MPVVVIEASVLVDIFEGQKDGYGAKLLALLAYGNIARALDEAAAIAEDGPTCTPACGEEAQLRMLLLSKRSGWHCMIGWASCQMTGDSPRPGRTSGTYARTWNSAGH